MPPRVHTLKLGPLDNNTYVVACEATREAAILDVGFEPEPVIDLVRAEGLQPRWLLCTHAHYDHAAGMLPVQRAVGGVFALHPFDRPLLGALSLQGEMFGFPHAEPPEIGHELVDREILRFGEVEVEVVFTPGHAPGHCAFRIGELVFVGDVLFRGAVGRTDLPGASFETLSRSIRERLFTLDDAVRCLPGHGGETTVGRERRTNPFVGENAESA